MSSSITGNAAVALLRKARGAFFTPPELAQFITNWAITESSDRILEPSAGEGVFLKPIVERLISLGATPKDVELGVQAFEIHQQSAQAAKKSITEMGYSVAICNGDFLAKSPKPEYSAVVGNPPYVRYRNVSKKQQREIDTIAKRNDISISSQASIWMPFVVHSASFLKKGGRMGFVLPAELLSVNYAATLRSFLLERFSSIRLITFDEPVFPEIQEEVVVLLASGWGEGSCPAISWQQCGGLEDLPQARAVDYVPEAAHKRWSKLFASHEAVASLSRLSESESFVPLEKWGRIALGIVTGGNKFFALSQDEVNDLEIPESELVPVSQPGSKHLRRIDYGKGDWEHARNGGAKTYLFYPGETPSDAATEYIAQGEKSKISQGYKCQKRNPWWRVPLGKAPDAFITSMNSYCPNICLNSAGAYVLNSCHGLFFDDETDDDLRKLLPIACLNSVTLFGAELIGRPYGGGMLKVEPREAARMPVPSTDLVEKCKGELLMIKPLVETALEKRDFDGAVTVVDSVLLPKMPIDEAELLQMKSNGALMRMRRRNRSRKFRAVR